MGDCFYCSKDAGFLKSKHSDCETKHTNGCAALKSLLMNAFISGIDFYTIDKQIKVILLDGFINSEKLRQIYLNAFDEAILNYLTNGVISDTEKKIVARFQQYTSLPQQVLNSNKSLEKVVQSDILQAILNGIIPTPSITIQGALPFIIAKDEKILWVFRDVELVEQKVKREFRGRSHGVSFKVMKGVYYRVGEFRGEPIETTQMLSIGKGVLVLTDKTIYYNCQQKSLKIPYKKLISIESYSDGVGFQKDGASSKPFFLKGIDSWFTYNLITNLQTI
jgi:hypothetical protein